MAEDTSPIAIRNLRPSCTLHIVRVRALAGACLVLGASVGWWVGQQINAARQVHQELASALHGMRRSVEELRGSVDMLAAADTTTVLLEGEADAHGAEGRLFLSPALGGVIAASHMPSLPPGQTYRVWLLLASGIIGGGGVPVDAHGRIFSTIEAPSDTTQLIAVIVTLEPEKSGEMISTNMVLFGRPDD